MMRREKNIFGLYTRFMMQSTDIDFLSLSNEVKPGHVTSYADSILSCSHNIVFMLLLRYWIHGPAHKQSYWVSRADKKGAEKHWDETDYTKHRWLQMSEEQVSFSRLSSNSESKLLFNFDCQDFKILP